MTKEETSQLTHEVCSRDDGKESLVYMLNTVDYPVRQESIDRANSKMLNTALNLEQSGDIGFPRNGNIVP